MTTDYTTQNETACTGAWNGYICANKIVASDNGILQSIGLKVGNVCSLMTLLYLDNGGSPVSGQLLLASPSTSVGGAGWADLAVPPYAIVKNSTYWPAFMISAAVTCYYHGGAATDYFKGGQTYGYVPNPFPAGGSTDNYIPEMRMIYNPVKPHKVMKLVVSGLP
jgi:hypothetical protein